MLSKYDYFLKFFLIMVDLIANLKSICIQEIDALFSSNGQIISFEESWVGTFIDSLNLRDFLVREIHN